jgi:hypothetical protein
MMIELTQAIHKQLKDYGLDVREFGYKDLIDKSINLVVPAVNVTINRATAEKTTMTAYKWVLYVSLLIVYKNVSGGWVGEATRKEGAYELIENVTKILLLNKFGLDLQNPLIPDGFRNITDKALEMAGYQLYEVNFWCSYNTTFEEIQDRDEGIITSIYSKYFLEPPDSTSVVNTTVLMDSTSILTV